MKFILSVTLVLALSLFSSCSTSQEKKSEVEETETYITQTEALNKRKTEFGKKANDTIKTIYQEGLDAVKASGVLALAKNVGDTAPNFTLKNATGKEVSLQAYLAKGPVVLVWYRGGWCPYCNINLHYLQEELPNFTKLGANLLALSPELPDNSMTTAQKNDLEFEILSDCENKVGKKFGVVFKLTKDVADIYNDKFELNEHNGDSSNELPIAATYIINTNGIIEYAFLDYDYRNRAEPSEITEELKRLQ